MLFRSTYKSAKKKIATIDAEGKLTLLSAGKTTITVTAIQEIQKGKKIKKKKVTASIALTVIDPTIPTSISIDQGTACTIYLGKPDIQLKVSAQPVGTADDTVTWKSAKPKIVKVESDGTLTPIKAGSAKITATSTKNKKAKATITVTVVDLTVPAGITITNTETTLQVGNTLELKYKLERQDPEVEAVSAVTWKVNNKKVAKVAKDGTVTGLKFGTVTITATTTTGKKTAQITLTVVEGEGEAITPLTEEEPLEWAQPEDEVEDPNEATPEEPDPEEPEAEEPETAEPTTDTEWNDWYGEVPATDEMVQDEEF